MVKKSELLEQKFDILEEYANDQKLPFFHKIRDLRKKYSLEFIVGLIERFLIEPYKQNLLKEYIEAELERLKIICVANGEDTELLKFRLSEQQLDLIVEHISYIVKIIQL